MNQKGSVLLGVLLIVGFTLLVGVPVLHAATTEHKAAINDQLDAQAFYLAEAGIEHCKQEALAILQVMSEAGWWPGDDIASPFARVQRDDYGPGDYDASAFFVDNGDGTYGIRIESEGIVGGTTGLARGTRVSFPLLSDDSPGGGDGGGGAGSAPPLNLALFASDGIRISGSGGIAGGAGTNSTASDAVSLTGSGSITGGLKIGVGGYANTVVEVKGSGRVTGGISNLATERNYPMPKMPDLPNDLDRKMSHGSLIDADAHYDQIKINGSSGLTIDVGSGERRIRVDDFSMAGSGSLTITGTGDLLLYVDDDFKVTGSGSFNATGSEQRVWIYYYGNDDFKISGSGAFRGSIQTATADIKQTGSGDFAGNLIVGGDEVDLTGSGTASISLIYAPAASFDMSGSNRINGAVVCRTAKLTGSGNVTYNGGVSSVYNDLVGGGSGGSYSFGGSIWAPTR